MVMSEDIPDYRTPVPDVGHENLRRALAAGLDDLAVQVRRLNGALLLLQATADFAQGTLNTSMSAHTQMTAFASRLGALEAGGQQMQAALASLTERVAALEPAPEPEPEPVEPPPTEPEPEPEPPTEAT